jgi:hypothetical protein
MGRETWLLRATISKVTGNHGLLENSPPFSSMIFPAISPFRSGIFEYTMFDDTRGYPHKKPINHYNYNNRWKVIFLLLDDQFLLVEGFNFCPPQ